MPGLIILGIIIEIVRSSWVNVLFLLALLLTNGLIAFQEERRSQKSLRLISSSLSENSLVKRDGIWQDVPARELVVGDRVKLIPGNIFLADCMVSKGHCQVDQSMTSGEVLPIEKNESDFVYQGSICLGGEIEAVVRATGPRTQYSKAYLRSHTLEQGGNLQKLLMRVSFLLLIVSALLVIIIMVVVMVKGNEFTASFSICVILMVASIPIAMKAVCSTTMAAGAKSMASKHVLLRRISALEDLAGMEVLCCDKTGILTSNSLQVKEPYCIKHSLTDVVLAAGLATRRNSQNQNSIDKALTEFATLTHSINFQWYEEEEFTPFDPRLKRSEAQIRNTRTGESFRCAKGAPQIILSMVKDPSIEDDVTKKVEALAARGFRTLGVARTNANGNWIMYGLIPLMDPPREDSADSLQKAMNIGIKVKMITGDQISIARETSRVLCLGDKIYNSEIFTENANSVQRELVDSIIDDADGFAEVFPEHRFAIVKLLQNKGYKVGVTGSKVTDGISLKKADIGIAIDSACEAAKALGDIILKEQGISVIIRAIYQARKTFEKMHNYCIYRIACSFQILVFYFLTMVSLDPHDDFRCSGVERCRDVPNTFAPPIVTLVIIAFLNDFIIVSLAYDHVMVSRKPCKWNFLLIICTSCSLGIVSFFSSLAFLLISLKNMNNNNPNSFMNFFGIEPLNYGEILCGVYLKTSLSLFLTVFSARSRSWFWTRMPGKLVIFSVVAAMIASTVISLFWALDDSEDKYHGNPNMNPINANLVIFIWVYDLVFFVIQDLLKILMIAGFESYYSIKGKDKEFFPPVLTDTFSQNKEIERRKTIVTHRSYQAANETGRPLSFKLSL
jgi:H+-transporting ATPase